MGPPAPRGGRGLRERVGGAGWRICASRATRCRFTRRRPPFSHPPRLPTATDRRDGARVCLPPDRSCCLSSGPARARAQRSTNLPRPRGQLNRAGWLDRGGARAAPRVVKERLQRGMVPSRRRSVRPAQRPSDDQFALSRLECPGHREQLHNLDAGGLLTRTQGRRIGNLNGKAAGTRRAPRGPRWRGRCTHRSWRISARGRSLSRPRSRPCEPVCLPAPRARPPR